MINFASGKTRKSLALVLLILVQFAFMPVHQVYAANTPAFGQAASFAILSSTYTNTVGGTTITGDVGYTTGPVSAPTINGTVYSPPSSKYSTAGTDQGAALAALASQPCTHTFPAGAVNLATDTSHGTIGVYTPGVYCTTAASAASVGTGGISLVGGGTYIFRIDGALTTAANSVVSVANGANSCDVFWTPTGATTLGANTTFLGTDIDAAGITIGSTVTWTGRALAFGGTVSTTVDTISAPSCAGADATAGTIVSSGSSSSSSSSTSSSTGGYTAPSCPPLNDVVAPLIIASRRISPTSIFISWGPYSGIDTFNVRYGTTNGEWLYNVDVSGFSMTINDLPVNQPIWVQVAARNCSIGTYGAPKLVGGPSLPNTGSAPIQTGVFGFLFSFLKLFHV